MTTSTSDDGSWATTGWAVVTHSGMLQARCGRPVGPRSQPCRAWRLSSPDGTAWKPCYACGAVEPPAVIEAAGSEAIAVAQAKHAAWSSPSGSETASPGQGIH
jgi:hypothetical protein